MIHHSVYFKFKLGLSAIEIQDFFKAANLLSAIPGVQNFEVVKEISPKNDFEFGLSMVFVMLAPMESRNERMQGIQPGSM